MPATGESSSAARILVIPSSRPSMRAENPQLTCPGPATTAVTPTRPPTSAWVDDEGMVRRQVITFHSAAPAIPAAMIASAVAGSSSVRTTNPPIVSATAVPARNGPARAMIPKRASAPAGRSARVATAGAEISAASWNPLVTLKATAARIVRVSKTVSTPSPYAPARARACHGIAAHRAPSAAPSEAPPSPGGDARSSERSLAPVRVSPERTRAGGRRGTARSR